MVIDKGKLIAERLGLDAETRSSRTKAQRDTASTTLQEVFP